MSLNSISVRPMAESDLDAVAMLDHRLAGQSRHGFYVKRLAAASLAPNAFLGLVAEMDGRLVGFVSAHVLDGEFGGTDPAAVLDAIGTAPDLRGRGVARALMTAFEAEARRRGIRQIQSEVNWTNHGLVRFFADAGFGLAPQVVLECATTAEI